MKIRYIKLSLIDQTQYMEIRVADKGVGIAPGIQVKNI